MTILRNVVGEPRRRWCSAKAADSECSSIITRPDSKGLPRLGLVDTVVVLCYILALRWLYRKPPVQVARFWIGLASALLVTIASGCAVRRTTRIDPSRTPPPAREASLANLAAQINAQEQTIRSISATVDLEPTAGSVYSGVIREYRDVKGFILVERPAMIRMVGQAPVVRTQIFDMVSDGEEFRLYIPPKQKFIVGKAGLRRPAKNALENLRPQHILDALLIQPIEAARERYFQEEAEENGRRYYVVSILEAGGEGELSLRRKVWFDRSNLEIVRVQIYGPGGSYIEDIQYSRYQDFQGVRYPARIEVSRPVEDYRLAINILKAVFNQPIAPDKFRLEKPAEAQLVEIGRAEERKEPRGQ